ncbi:hypothetical protein DL95DRAFT_463827 [Leptodontidium sp. 2 PMI_412]|nr:hypothetical protein DL95DRAFT_463827 [Leptodontidium sp. 2 PMI_412]
MKFSTLLIQVALAIFAASLILTPAYLILTPSHPCDSKGTIHGIPLNTTGTIEEIYAEAAKDPLFSTFQNTKDIALAAREKAIPTKILCISVPGQDGYMANQAAIEDGIRYLRGMRSSHDEPTWNMDYADKIAFQYSSYQKDDAEDTIKRDENQTAPPTVCYPNAKVQYLDAGNERLHTTSLLLFQMGQLVLRLAAILHAILSLYLILSPVVAFLSAQNTPGNPLGSIPGSRIITTRSSIVFITLVGANLGANIMLLVFFCCLSNKVQKARSAFGVVIIGIFVGFATALGAFLVLKQRTAPPSDLWSWSCDNKNLGIVSEALDFTGTCHSISRGWKYSIALVSFEALSIAFEMGGFALSKHWGYSPYGTFGERS